MQHKYVIIQYVFKRSCIQAWSRSLSMLVAFAMVMVHVCVGSAVSIKLEEVWHRQHKWIHMTTILHYWCIMWLYNKLTSLMLVYCLEVICWCCEGGGIGAWVLSALVAEKLLTNERWVSPHTYQNWILDQRTIVSRTWRRVMLRWILKLFDDAVMEVMVHARTGGRVVAEWRVFLSKSIMKHGRLVSLHTYHRSFVI